MSPGASQKRTRVKRERFLPHAYMRMGLQLNVVGCEVDGRPEPESIDREQHRVNADQAPWQTLALQLELRVGPDVLETTLPPGERHGRAATAYVLVRCEGTRLRRAELVGAPSGKMPLRSTIRLNRDELHGLVELRPLLVRSRAANDAPPGYATEPGMRLAGGRPWEVRAEQTRPVQGKFLEVVYRSFQQDPQLAPYAASVYRVECDAETPRLWINSDHAKVTSIMDDRGTTGARARMREVFFDLVSQSVWTQLFVRAATHVGETGETVHDWETSVLQQLLPGIYPRLRTHSQRLERLRAELHEGDWTPLLQRLDAALQDRHQVASHMSRLIEETVEGSR